MRNSRICCLYCRQQCVDDVVLHEIGEVSGRYWAIEVSPTILDLLVLGERIGDQRKGADLVSKDGTKCLRGFTANLAIRIAKTIKDFRFGQIFAMEREA